MKYLWIMLIMCLCGCNTLTPEAKRLQHTTFCLNGIKFIITSCYDTIDPDVCHIINVKHPVIAFSLKTDVIEELMNQIDKECP